MVKQADLVFAIYLCGDRWDEEQKARDFAYYETVTVRDSSLSASIQAVVAAEVGHLELAYDYLTESAFIDLRDIAFNTHDGLHMASLSGVWHAIVGGFGGMRDYGETLSFAPRLPSRLSRLRFGVIYPRPPAARGGAARPGELRAARRRAASSCSTTASDHRERGRAAELPGPAGAAPASRRRTQPASRKPPLGVSLAAAD